MEIPVSSIVKQIYDKFEQDPRTRGAIIDVGFNQGMAVLTGSVKSAKIAQAAEEIAREQSGVVSVINELKVG
jgi:osmotically-inducible protein OsmY